MKIKVVITKTKNKSSKEDREDYINKPPTKFSLKMLIGSREKTNKLENLLRNVVI